MLLSASLLSPPLFEWCGGVRVSLIDCFFVLLRLLYSKSFLYSQSILYSKPFLFARCQMFQEETMRLASEGEIRVRFLPPPFVYVKYTESSAFLLEGNQVECERDDTARRHVMASAACIATCYIRCKADAVQKMRCVSLYGYVLCLFFIQ
jgi:hypothetical protein